MKTQMAEDPFDLDRKVLMAAIRTLASHASDAIGKSSFDERVVAAMAKVPRHEFVPFELQPYAYANIPLPMANPLTTDITKLFFYNKGTGTATPAVAVVTAGFLLKQETQTA